MKTAIITTVRHNVGDDFVREGLKYLIRESVPDKKIQFQNIHKHSPITVRHNFEWFRSLRYSRWFERILPMWLTRDRINDAQLVVQSGAPVYWCHEQDNSHCCDVEWYQPLVKKRFSKNKKDKQLINIAAGTCQRYHSRGAEFCGRCADYLVDFSALSEVTTARDELTRKLFEQQGIEVKVIPCCSIFAVDEHHVQAGVGEYIVMNYMENGSHFTFGQKIEKENWARAFKSFYTKLSKKEKVILVCHNQKEVNDAKSILPNAEIFYCEDDYLAYMNFYRHAKLGIVNRVHSAFMMASLGKPSVVIGNDSRACMVEQIGLRHYFVNDVSAELLLREYQQMLIDLKGYPKIISDIKAQAYKDYIDALTVLKG